MRFIKFSIYFHIPAAKRGNTVCARIMIYQPGRKFKLIVQASRHTGSVGS